MKQLNACITRHALCLTQKRPLRSSLCNTPICWLQHAGQPTQYWETPVSLQSACTYIIVSEKMSNSFSVQNTCMCLGIQLRMHACTLDHLLASSCVALLHYSVFMQFHTHSQCILYYTQCMHVDVCMHGLSMVMVIIKRSMRCMSFKENNSHA